MYMSTTPYWQRLARQLINIAAKEMATKAALKAAAAEKQHALFGLAQRATLKEKQG